MDFNGINRDMETISLYLKTHNVTGKKYLGKTIQDPFKYGGSGTVWMRHLKKHGNDVTTEILFQTTDKDEFKKFAAEKSREWNIVESKEFLNLCAEEGQGGRTVYTEERNQKISKANKGRPNTWTKSGEESSNHGMIVAKNKETGEIVRVTADEFKSNESLIGSQAGSKHDNYKDKTGYKKTGKIVVFEGKEYHSIRALAREIGVSRPVVGRLIREGKVTYKMETEQLS